MAVVTPLELEQERSSGESASQPHRAVRGQGQAHAVAGGRGELVMSGASTSWHDLVLYLVGRQLGPPVAHVLAKFLAMQWHSDGQSPFMIFTPTLDHGDTAIAKAQQWLFANAAVAKPVEEMVRLSGLPERTFKRRFQKATGLSPIQYVQHLRIDKAKRRLERTRGPVDEISASVGYEDPAFFRRLFKRLTGVSPSAYRRMYAMPAFDLPSTVSPRGSASPLPL